VKAFRNDLIAAAVVALVCGIASSVYLFAFTGPMSPSHGPEPTWFSPAIMVATGHGLTAPVPASAPGLPEFLLQQTLTFDATTLPPDVKTWDLDSFSSTHRYLLYSVGWVWRLFGVSWQTIKIVPLLSHILSAVLLYGLFRLLSRPLTSSLACTFVMLSPPVMAMLPSVRDFCKMPFFLGILLILGVLASRPLGYRQCLAAAVALGMLCGIGLGFRQDFLACIPPAILGVALISHGPDLSWRRRLACAALVPVAFLVSGYPVLRAVLAENGAVSSHSLAQGLSTEAMARLGVGGGSYALLPTTSDTLVHAVITNHAQRNGFQEPIEQYLSPAYGEAGRAYFRQVARTFPYDLALRAFAAVWASFKTLPMAPIELEGSPLTDNAWYRVLVPVYGFPAWLLGWAGPLAALLVVAGLGGIRPQSALALLLLGLYFTGYTSVLFQFRHAFHLAFIAPWFVIACAVGARKIWATPSSFSARKGAAFVLGMLVVILSAMTLLRLHQHHQVRGLMEQYRQSARTELGVEKSETVGGELLAPRLSIEQAAAGNRNLMESPSTLLAVEFKAGRIPSEFRMLYDAKAGGSDFSETVTLPEHLADSGGPLTYCFPVYLAASYVNPEGATPDGVNLNLTVARARFKGIEVPDSCGDCVEGISEFSHPEALPFFLYAWLSPDEADMRLHHRWGGARKE
jgi:hypothetical protein